MVASRCATTSAVVPSIRCHSASCTSDSDSESSAEVASSRTSTLAPLAMACAMATRWRWPPESFMPRSPTTVSYPSGRRSTNSST